MIEDLAHGDFLWRVLDTSRKVLSVHPSFERKMCSICMEPNRVLTFDLEGEEDDDSDEPGLCEDDSENDVSI